MSVSASDDSNRAALYESAASEVLRALRGRRSQVALARRLGYRANPITDWENGRRFPTIAEVLRVARVVGVPTHAAFERLGSWEASSDEATRPKSASQQRSAEDADAERVARWLDALKGSMSITDLAEQAQRSRYAVSRWLSADTQPRLPDFLRLVDAASGRVQEWVDQLVGIDQVPSLQGRFDRVEAARRLALDEPWTEAILRILETEDARRSAQPLQHVARLLGLDDDLVQELVAALCAAGVVAENSGSFEVTGGLTVDTQSSRERLNALRRHWAGVARSRLDEHPEQDWFAYNVIAVSREDSERIERRLRAAYREVRSIVAESKPEQIGCLLTIHMVRWDEADATNRADCAD